MAAVNCEFCLSDALHSRSKDNTSVNIQPNPSLADRGQYRAVCYRNNRSFYKSTRKVRRSARELFPLVHGDDAGEDIDNITATEYIAYWIVNGESTGNPTSSPLDRNDATIRRRLESEFGPPININLNVDVENPNPLSDRGSIQQMYGSPVLDLIKFAFPDNSVESKTNDFSLLDRITNRVILFLDLDAIAHSLCLSPLFFSTTDNPKHHLQMHHRLLGRIIFSFLHQTCRGARIDAVIHLKSDVLHRAVSEIISSDLMNKFTPNSCFVQSFEIEEYIKVEQIETGELKQSANVIRRLRSKMSAADCPLSLYPARFIEVTNPDGQYRLIEICRFHNYDSERGCLRSKKARLNSYGGGCDMDHTHCHHCAQIGHRAFECPKRGNKRVCTGEVVAPVNTLHPSVFIKAQHNSFEPIPLSEYTMVKSKDQSLDLSIAPPTLLVIGGRLRGRTLASCEALPLSWDDDVNSCQWRNFPNILQHRGSHASCSPMGTGLIFAMGGGGVDGNLDTVEMFHFGDEMSKTGREPSVDRRWQILSAILSCPRHAFGSVACITTENPTLKSKIIVNVFAVGGWKYGSKSCETTEKLKFTFPLEDSISEQWEVCAPLIKPRRLHSVVASADGLSIYVFGGYVNERHTTSSIELYDIASDEWRAVDDLPYGAHNCPLVQAVADWTSPNQNSFIIFPFGSHEKRKSSKDFGHHLVLRYIPGSDNPFSPILIPSLNENQSDREKLKLPIDNWASFSVTSSRIHSKAYLIGGTIDGKWTARGFSLDFLSMSWKELPQMECARRRSAAVVVE